MHLISNRCTPFYKTTRRTSHSPAALAHLHITSVTELPRITSPSQEMLAFPESEVERDRWIRTLMISLAALPQPQRDLTLQVSMAHLRASIDIHQITAPAALGPDFLRHTSLSGVPFHSLFGRCVLLVECHAHNDVAGALDAQLWAGHSFRPAGRSRSSKGGFASVAPHSHIAGAVRARP